MPPLSPTVSRRILAEQLKRLRLAANIKRDEAADYLGRTGTLITRIEAMTTAAEVGYVEKLLDLYRVEDPEQREFLMSLARDARKQGWWHPYRAAIPPWFETFVGLESAASKVRGYYAELIPGLLQTPDYYRACLVQDPVTPNPEHVEQMIRFRLARQERLTGPNGHDFWLILSEAAIKRQVGGPEVMRAQVQHLYDKGMQPNITIQVIPFTVGAHSAMSGGFVVLEFPERAHGDVVYVESQSDARYLEDHEVVNHYNRVFNHLRAQALSPQASMAALKQALEPA